MTDTEKINSILEEVILCGASCNCCSRRRQLTTALRIALAWLRNREVPHDITCSVERNIAKALEGK